MKKLDKFVLKAFLGPFFLTFIVVVFILLMQYLLKYFDEIVGKGLGPLVYAEMLFYFAVSLTALALPLAVLLSSLMTFGNLGEHFELTAIKSSGISLVRTMLPIFMFTVVLAVLAFYNNDQLIPKVNLKAYSLLYDIRQTKPSMSLQEGSFYNGLPNYSIKVNEKFDDEVSLKGLIIYDHSLGKGNTDVIVADSGRMLSFGNDQYLMLEMFDGYRYSEPKPDLVGAMNNKPGEFVRNGFSRSRIVFDMASFGMKPTPEEYFAENKIMKNIGQLRSDIDSMNNKIVEARYTIYQNAKNYNPFTNKARLDIPEQLEQRYKVVDSLNREKMRQRELSDSLAPPLTDFAYGAPDGGLPESQLVALERSGSEAEQALNRKEFSPVLADTSRLKAVEKKVSTPKALKDVYQSAVGQVRYIKNNYDVYGAKADDLRRAIYQWEIEIHKKWSQAVACLVMFLIGAPLGAIIKRGGLGIPVIVSIAFFIIYYVFTMFGEKWAREGIVSPELGIWSANLILLPFGLFFLRQARNDARLFESDFYSVMIAKFRGILGEKILKPGVLKQKLRWPSR